MHIYKPKRGIAPNQSGHLLPFAVDYATIFATVRIIRQYCETSAVAFLVRSRRALLERVLVNFQAMEERHIRANKFKRIVQHGGKRYLGKKMDPRLLDSIGNATGLQMLSWKLQDVIELRRTARGERVSKQIASHSVTTCVIPDWPLPHACGVGHQH